MKRLVIIGGGFAGSIVARKLERFFNVTLIDSKDYFEYTPGILRAIIKPWHIKRIQVFHKDYLKQAKLIVGFVKSIERNCVIVKNKRINYDYLVICSGSNYNYPIKEQGVVIASRTRHLVDSYRRLEKAKTIVIIGGGLVGVELAGEICTFYKDKKVTIVNSKSNLINRNNKRTIAYVEKFFRLHNVNLFLGEKVNKFKRNKIITDSGRKINADVIFVSTGIKPNFEFMTKNYSNLLNEYGQIIVDNHLKVKGEDRIFAAGDVTSIPEGKTAQNAERQANVVVKNLLNIKNGRDLVSYNKKDTALVISLGKYDGVFEYKNFVLRGLIPAFMKFLIEKWVMMKYGKFI